MAPQRVSAGRGHGRDRDDSLYPCRDPNDDHGPDARGRLPNNLRNSAGHHDGAPPIARRGTEAASSSHCATSNDGPVDTNSLLPK